MYFVYVLRCVGSSLYCGYTNDVAHRVDSHLGLHPNGAKYTRSRKPLRVEAVWETQTKQDAMRLESRFKKLSKEKKELIVAGAELDGVFGDLIDSSLYSLRPDLTGAIRGNNNEDIVDL